MDAVTGPDHTQYTFTYNGSDLAGNLTSQDGTDIYYSGWGQRDKEERGRPLAPPGCISLPGREMRMRHVGMGGLGVAMRGVGRFFRFGADVAAAVGVSRRVEALGEGAG